MVTAKILNVNGTMQIILATILLLLYYGYLVKTDARIRNILEQHRILKKN